MNETNMQLIEVSFACQRCCQPLKMNSTLNTINEQIVNELSSNTINIDTNDENIFASKEVNKNVIYKVVQPIRDSTNGNGFIVIEDSNSSLTPSMSSIGLNISNDNKNESTFSGNTQKFNKETKMYRELFDILSDQSDVDHPLCEECADFVIDQMDHQLKILEDECRHYSDYLQKIQSEENVDQNETQLEINELKEKLKSLENTEKELTQQLEQINSEELKVNEEIVKHSNELQRLYSEEDKYWHEYNNVRNNVFICDDEQQSIDNQLRYAQTLFDKLKRTTVFNATFHIWHSGPFGTINNFRLGRLPNIPVEWAEINAAWGQSALLLHSLANKMNFTFERYKIVPYGNHSFLESLEDKSRELPLYASGGIRYFWNSKFDQAMVAFLDCLQQFKEEVQKGDSGFCLPYKMMEKGWIEDTKTGNKYCVKIQFNSEEQWTKALKFMLTNLKWALAWVSSQFVSKT